MRFFRIAAMLCALALPFPALAGETGHYTPGADFFENGSLPPAPGFYMKNYLINYRASTLRDGNGNKVHSDFKLETVALVNRFLYVTDAKFLGADVALHAIVPFAYADVTTPFGQKQDHSGVGDIMLEPVLLGWHGEQWDALVGLGVFLPTGKWERGDPANIGKDFYTGMLSTGFTWHFDQERTTRAGARLRYEKHSSNRTLKMRHGDDLTLEYSLSRTFWGCLDLGASGYAQWQITRDSGQDVTWNRDDKDRIYALGPEIRLAIPAIQGALTFNYLKEFGARDHAEGQLFALSLSLAF